MITERGYLAVLPYDTWNAKVTRCYDYFLSTQATQQVPPLAQHQQFAPDSITMETGETSPPSLLTEVDLLSLMERNEIGLALPLVARHLMSPRHGRHYG
jgi:DNA topoisomerase-3